MRGTQQAGGQGGRKWVVMYLNVLILPRGESGTDGEKCNAPACMNLSSTQMSGVVRNNSEVQTIA